MLTYLRVGEYVCRSICVLDYLCMGKVSVCDDPVLQAQHQIWRALAPLGLPAHVNHGRAANVSA